MTIETTANRISYTGSGTTGPFSFPYYFLADGDLTVIKTTIADGTEETLTLTTDYTVSGAGEAAGGSVTLVATLSSAYKLTIIRDPDILQPADYPANDRFPAATHEEALDRATMILQRLKDLIDRSFRLSDGDVSGISLILQNLGAGKLIAVNSAGTGIESIAAADVDLTTVSAFIQTLLDDADAATARTTLGAASLGANTFTGLQTFAAGADIASATTVDLTAATGNLVRITGTTATTGVTINNGQVVLCYPTGAWPLTYHATNMPIKGGVSYTCAAGDTVIFTKDGNGSLHVDIIPAALHPAIVSQATAEAGTDTTARLWTAERVKQAIAALGSSITLGTPVASTSGTSIDFTSIPSGTKRITVNFVGVTTNGTSPPIIQLGDSGGVETSGYLGTCSVFSTTVATTNYTNGVGLTTTWGPTLVLHGSVTFTKENSSTNTWCASGVIGRSDLAGTHCMGATKSLSAELDRVRITTSGGADTFDAGEINITYE